MKGCLIIAKSRIISQGNENQLVQIFFSGPSKLGFLRKGYHLQAELCEGVSLPTFHRHRILFSSLKPSSKPALLASPVRPTFQNLGLRGRNMRRNIGILKARSH
uniref:Uncharacterized protein n=1 Tax=Picea glauca TaxID=3330 RepID=A0A101M2X4_PICGL|nr:hypothetical protein ABT39_MTgene3294 [Picea glauca]QHR89190.1 hypothetical protein Q903MT_gene3210 [Picea sitchensis]